MKRFLQIQNTFTSLIVMIVCLISCEEKKELPLEEFYGFDNLATLKMKALPKKYYFLGTEKESISLEVIAFEKDGKLLRIPTEAIDFYANDEKLDANTFNPVKAGKYNLGGKLGNVASETMEIEVIDPASLRIELSALNESSGDYLANGADTIAFNARLMRADEPLDAPSPIVFRANNDTFSKTFSTRSAGNYRFTATTLGVTSNTIQVNFVAPPVHDVVRLPVIFHEVNRTNLTASAIKGYTDEMTRAFRNRILSSNAPKAAKSTDLYIEFYPATTGPDGRTLAVPGLDRVTSAKSAFTQEETTQDAFNYFWDPERVVNVWVYPNISGEYSAFSWAYYPFVTQPKEGFSVINEKVEPFFPYGIFLNEAHLAANVEEILSHEAGHMFGLAHVFGGGGNDYSACSATDPDYCHDTEYYDRNVYAGSIQQNADNFRRVSCDGKRYVSTNLMDYYYTHNNSFTIEQLKRVRHTVDYGLWLPTVFNGARNARMSGSFTKVKRPASWRNVKPVVCMKP